MQVIEVIGAVFGFVGNRGSAEALDLGVVRAAGGGDLGVPVDNGAPGPPEAVPHEERVAGLWVGFEGLPAPLEPHGDVVGDLLRGEVEGVVVVEDDDAVEGVVLGDVRGGYRVLAFYAAEDVGGGCFLRAGGRVPRGGPLFSPGGVGSPPCETSGGVPSCGRQNGSPAVASISRSRSRLTPVSSGREARKPLKRVPSSVTRFVTFTMRCSRTASTEPKERSIQAFIASGGSRRPVVAETAKMRSVRVLSSVVRAEIRPGRLVICLSANTEAIPSVRRRRRGGRRRRAGLSCARRGPRRPA